MTKYAYGNFLDDSIHIEIDESNIFEFPYIDRSKGTQYIIRLTEIENKLYYIILKENRIEIGLRDYFSPFACRAPLWWSEFDFDRMNDVQKKKLFMYQLKYYR